jgi:hypothetical protein
VEQAVYLGLVLLILLLSMGLRWWALRRRAPENRDADADRLERWVRHVTRGGDED